MNGKIIAKFDRYIAVKRFWWAWVLVFLAMIAAIVWFFAADPFGRKPKYDVPDGGFCELCGATLESELEYEVGQVYGTPEHCRDVEIYAHYRCPRHGGRPGVDPVYIATETRDHYFYIDHGDAAFKATGVRYSIGDECNYCGLPISEYDGEVADPKEWAFE